VTDNEVGQPNGPALRVVTEFTPLFVARRSFGDTKLLSSRLDWREFSHNRSNYAGVVKPVQLDHFCCAKIGTRTVLAESPLATSTLKRGLIVYAVCQNSGNVLSTLVGR